MDKFLKMIILIAVLVPVVAIAGKYEQGTTRIEKTTINGGSGSFMDAYMNNRYTTDTTGYVTLNGTHNGTITIVGKATPWSGTCTQCLTDFSCTIPASSALYATAKSLLTSANVGVRVYASRYIYTGASSDCLSLTVYNSSSYIK